MLKPQFFIRPDSDAEWRRISPEEAMKWIDRMTDFPDLFEGVVVAEVDGDVEVAA